MIRFFQLFFFSIFFFSSLEASLRIFPRVIYSDTTNKYINVFIENPSQQDRVYKMNLQYTNATPDGHFYKIKKEDLTDKDRSFCSNLKVFPKKIKVSANSSQRVRLIIKNFDRSKYNKAEYYCRLYVKSLLDNESKYNADNGENVKSNLSFALVIGAPIHIVLDYKKADLDIKSYGYRINHGIFYYKLKIINKSDIGFRAIVRLDFYDENGDLKYTLNRSVVNQGGYNNILFKSDKNQIDFSKKYTVKVTMHDSLDVDKSFKQFKKDKFIEEFTVN